MKRRMTGVVLGLGLVVILLAGCTGATASGGVEDRGSEEGPGEDETAAEAAAGESGVVEEGGAETAAEAGAGGEKELLAGTNIARHSVPLEEIYIDTFNGSSVPVSEATEAQVLRFRDAIPPVESPQYTDVETADQWLEPDDTVIGYVAGETALAYPTKILNFHEIVNETINGRPVLISYCPLCNSGVVYDRRLGDQVLEFGNTSALYQSDMVMYDRQTFSYWFQVEGQAIVGDLTGRRLDALPTRFMPWAAWRERYPASRVLSRETGFNRPYERDPFAGYAGYVNQGNFAFPVTEEALDPALPAGEQVVSLVIGDEARAYPLAALTGQVVNEAVGGVPVAVAVDEAGVATAFDRRVGDQTVTLAWDGAMLVDTGSDTLFDLNGQVLGGPLRGESLEILPTRFSFWFAFVAAFPEGTAYQP